MRSAKHILLYVSILFTFTSCIAENRDDCPPPSGLVIDVVDKNYDNIKDIEGLAPISENRPIQSYVASIYAWIQKTGRDSYEAVPLTVKANESSIRIPLDAYSNGDYTLYTTGNYPISAQTDFLENISFDLHPNGAEGIDLYIGHESFSIPLYSNTAVDLVRAKGKLLLRFVDFPINVYKIEATVSGIYSSVNKSGIYSGASTVKKTFMVGQPDDGIYYSLLLAPSSHMATTSLTLNLYDDADRLITTISDIDISINRNHLTVVQERYVSDEDKWEASLFVDGAWKVINNLIVQ